MVTGSLPLYKVGGEGEGEGEKGGEQRLSMLIGCETFVEIPEWRSAEESGELRGEKDKSEEGCF